MSRWGPSVDGSLSTLAVIAASVLTLSVVSLSSNPPSDVVASDVANEDGSGSGDGGSGDGGSGDSGGDSGTPGNSPGSGNGGTGNNGGGSGSNGGKTGTNVKTPTDTRVNASCLAGKNAGSSDRGVTGTKIKLGATVVQSGIGASFLGPVRFALNAVKNDVNRTGGICGRKLELKLIDDAWDADRGFRYIQNLVESDKVFALAVNPSSEGLRLASRNGYLSKTKTPVVGSDGMLNDQYTDPWIWPIAASTVSSMHIIAHDACTRLGKRRFGIVFDSRYHFGVEGAFAFNQAVKRCAGQEIPGYFDPSRGGGCSDRFCAISAGQSSYDTENKAFNDACFNRGTQGGTCEFVALLLEPNEALNFVRGGFLQDVPIGMAQTLFTRGFAAGCGSTCDGKMVWTGYNPPIEEFAQLPAVKRYIKLVTGENPNVDVSNQFLEGGYAGMTLLVEALKKAGPNLTRAGLRSILDNMDFDSGLTTPLKWRKGNHFANVAMQGFAIQYKGGFNGFRRVTGWVKDPWVGQDVH